MYFTSKSGLIGQRGLDNGLFYVAHAIEVDTPEGRDISMEIRKPISRRSFSSCSRVSIGSQEGMFNMALYTEHG